MALDWLCPFVCACFGALVSPTAAMAANTASLSMPGVYTSKTVLHALSMVRSR